MNNALRLGVIGCGMRAQLYLDGIERVQGLRPHAYADVNQDAAGLCLERYGGVYATDDAARVLADPEIEAVLISTWHDTHTAYAIEAARRGKHILIEKPLALTIDECWRIEEAVTRANVTMCVGLKMRFMPLVRRVKQLIPEPILLMGQMMNNRVPDDAWSLQPKIGGGTVIGAGCHTADLLCYFAGADPIEVHAYGNNVIHGMPDTVDNVVGTIKFANGVIASLIHGDPGRNPYTSTFFCQVFGQNKGASLYDRYRRASLWGCEQPALGVADLSEAERADVEGDVALLQHFAKNALTGKPGEASARQGRIATTIMVKMIESARTGLPMQIEADWRSRYD